MEILEAQYKSPKAQKANLKNTCLKEGHSEMLVFETHNKNHTTLRLFSKFINLPRVYREIKGKVKGNPIPTFPILTFPFPKLFLLEKFLEEYS